MMDSIVVEFLSKKVWKNYDASKKWKDFRWFNLVGQRSKMVGGVLVFAIVSFVKPSLVWPSTILSPKNTTWKSTWENDKEDMTS
jgi:hypothetical protein